MWIISQHKKEMINCKHIVKISVNDIALTIIADTDDGKSIMLGRCTTNDDLEYVFSKLIQAISDSKSIISVSELID